LIKHFAINPCDIYIYIYEQNVFFKIINFLNSPLLYLKYRKYIHNTSMNYEDYLNAISDSVYTLDYAHPKQTGLTMRCFDALNMRTKIITNNSFILSSPTFKTSEPIIFDMKKGEHIGSIAFDKALLMMPTRTISDFLDEILN